MKRLSFRILPILLLCCNLLHAREGANRLTGIDSRTSTNSVIASFVYTLDVNGNRTGIDKQPPSVTPLSARNETASYLHNRLTSIDTTLYAHDNEGQLSRKQGTTTTNYIFDDAYRLTEISAGTPISYSYDGSGNRLQATRNGIETRYIYDTTGNLLAETDSSNVITRYYIHGAGLLAAVTPTDTTYCYHYDGIGSTVAVTDSSQAVVNSYNYTPFGMILNESKTFSQPFKYVGKLGVMAEDSGFYYMRARYYDPVTGRFISEDPLGFGGGDVNLFVYAQNNPVMFMDPLGLFWFRQSWQTEFVVGRENSPLIAPGDTISQFIEDNVPAGRTFGEIHDGFVGAVTSAGISDTLANIPSMLPLYQVAIIVEVGRSLGIINQPTPSPKP